MVMYKFMLPTHILELIGLYRLFRPYCELSSSSVAFLLFLATAQFQHLDGDREALTMSSTNSIVR